MTFLKNTVSLLAVFTMIPGAFAATPRAGMVQGATVMAASGRRMPTVTMNMVAANNTAATTSSSTTSNLLDNIECIDAYTECITSDDSCGSDFSECTTNVLFHAQMPDCISTLAQCSSAGINSLFGTSSTTALSNVATTNEDGEVTRYTYPTDGSVLGQKIAAAAIENQYDTQTCVKRYLNCLHKDDVCGEDFELCTSDKEFKKQALFCDSTLARCQAAGVKELFGVSAWKPSSKAGIGAGRIATEIEAGADLAALNAVSTCYKMVDNCFMNACKSNPLRCIEGTSVASLQAAQGVVGDAGLTIDTVGEADVLSKSQVNRYLRSSCADTIGSNKYCHMTFLERTPSKKDLADPDYIDEVFSAAHNDRKSILESKIQGLMQEFDKDAKDKCNEVIASCAMRTCGGGSGAACYTQVFGNGATDKSINGSATYSDIQTGCAAIVNTDPNCIYAYETIKNGAYSYSYAANDAFSTLVPAYGSGEADHIGAVASLNSRLSTSYNDAAIANMRKQCQNVAKTCVKSMCGTDFVNCYRNRTDIYSDLTKSTGTDADAFNKSMNKVGGVLDYTIVLGLCVDTVKNAPVCEEHLAIERARYKKADDTTASWGSADSTRGGWYDAGSATAVTVDKETVQDVDANGNPLCYAANGDQGPCNTVGANGVAYTEPVMIEYYTYVQSQAAQSLFKDLIYDLEKEAQATYNAKLTKQQNMCMSSNTGGGVMGARDMGSTYMWVKLKNNKVPTDYPTMGLKPSQFVASNELYGSFCRIRVTLQSNDIDIMNAINGTLAVRDENNHREIKDADFSSKKDWATAYFAAGDAFTCGSWIPQSALMEIANAVGQNARADKSASQPKIAGWMGALGALGLGTGGAFLGDAIQDGNAFGGLTGKSKKKTPKTEANKCKTYMNAALDVTISIDASKGNNSSSFNSYVQRACDIIKEYDGESAACTTYRAALSDYKASVTATTASDVEDAMESIKAECGMIEDSDKKNDEKDEKWWDKSGGATIGAVVGAGAGFGLGYGITKAVQNAELDKAEQEAIQEFMDNVGSKIHCYIGGEEAGTFGDVITTSME